MFSSTVNERKMLRSCGTQPMPARARSSGRSVVTSRPPSVTLPPKRRVTPTMELINVVLPVPLRPSTASTCPSGGRSDTLGSTVASPEAARRFSVASRSGIARLAEINGLHLRVLGDLFGRAFRQQRAVDQHGNAIGKGEDEIHVMLDEQHSDIARQGRDDAENVVPLALRH